MTASVLRRPAYTRLEDLVRFVKILEETPWLILNIAGPVKFPDGAVSSAAGSSREPVAPAADLRRADIPVWSINLAISPRSHRADRVDMRQMILTRRSVCRGD